MKKKVLSLFMVLAITIFQFTPVTVSATTTLQQVNKIVNTTTDETLAFDGREHNSTVYAGEIKKDGVTVLNYLYSDDITRSSVEFDNLRKALSNPYSDMVPAIVGPQTTAGLHEISTQTLNGVDLTTITSDWTSASNIATQIYNGTNTDILNSNMYDVDNDFKSAIDNEASVRETGLDNPIETNKRIISHLGTQTTDDVSFKVIDGNLIEIHNVNLIYLSEATTVVYTSVNVITTETPQTTKIDTLNISVASPKAGEKATATTKPNVTIDSNPNYEIDHIAYVTAYPSEKTVGEYDAPFTGTFEENKDYVVEVSLVAKDGYAFTDNDNMTLKVNGKTTNFEKNEYNMDGSTYYMFFVKVQAEEEEKENKTYTISNDTYTATFAFEEGHNFKLNVFDALTMSIDEINAELDAEDTIDEDTYNQVMELIKNNIKSYGTLLAVYGIEIDDGNIGYSDGVKFKVKLTDQMKKYNTFKFIYLDDDNNYKVGDIVDFKVEGDYLVGTLPHLSTYALVGSKTTSNTTPNASNNPNTGDNIMIYISMLGLSVIGLVGTGIYLRKNGLN